MGGYSNSGDCTSTFGGTSAAAPLVAGVVALILQANPELGWRDVQHIFVNTSKITDATDSDWFTNGGGFRHNHKYGFGLVNAEAAVESARTHANLPPVRLAASAVSPVAKPLNDFTPVENTIRISRMFLSPISISFLLVTQRKSLLRLLKSPSLLSILTVETCTSL